MILIEQKEARNDNPRNWIDDMMTFLSSNRYPQGLDRAKRRQYRLRSIPYAIVDGILFWRDFNGALLRCIDTIQTKRIIKEFHGGPNGGQFLARTIATKIMRVGY